MRHVRKTRCVVVSSTKFALVAAFVAFVWIWCAIAKDDRISKEWKVGVPKPDSPHVITGETPGEYLPEPGWKFVSDTQDDFTVEPLPAKEVQVPAWGKNLRIPAPEGFWTLEDENLFAKLHKKIKANTDTTIKIIGWWARTESGWWDDLQSAEVQVAPAFYDKRFSLSTFEMGCESIRKKYDSLAKESTPVAKKMAKALSREAASLAETNINVSVGDVQFLPPYLVERDRICCTVIHKMQSAINGEKGISFSVTSIAMLWIRGTVFNLGVACVVQKASDIEVATAGTRDKLAKWIDAVETINGRASLDDEDVMARSDPNCIKRD